MHSRLGVLPQKQLVLIHEKPHYIRGSRTPGHHRHHQSERMSSNHQNKWRHGLTHFEIPPLDDRMGMRDGFLPLPVILDPTVGEEVALIARDQTPFMEELRQVNPFRLMLKNGCARNTFGPVVFLLFWVQNPIDPSPQKSQRGRKERDRVGKFRKVCQWMG